jgi:hypothetical protein
LHDDLYFHLSSDYDDDGSGDCGDHDGDDGDACGERNDALI